MEPVLTPGDLDHRPDQVVERLRPLQDGCQSERIGVQTPAQQRQLRGLLPVNPRWILAPEPAGEQYSGRRGDR